MSADEKRPLLIFLNEVAGGRKLLQATSLRKISRGRFSSALI